MMIDDTVTRWQLREKKNLLERLAAAARSFFTVALGHGTAWNLPARPTDEMPRAGAFLCARLKRFYTARPRPWRTWRGAQRTARRRHA